MANLLVLEVGDIISSTTGWSDSYQIVAWPENPNDDIIGLKELRSDGNLNTRTLSYNKSSLLAKNWRKLSSENERLIRSVGRHLALLGKATVPEVQELLFKLEI